MKPVECFGLIIRTLGLIFFMGGLYFFASSLVVVITPNLPHRSTPASYAIYGCVLVALSLYFLRGAPVLVRFAYPNETSSDHTHQE